LVGGGGRPAGAVQIKKGLNADTCCGEGAPVPPPPGGGGGGVCTGTSKKGYKT